MYKIRTINGQQFTIGSSALVRLTQEEEEEE